jgi:hypothetical protein
MLDLGIYIDSMIHGGLYDFSKTTGRFEPFSIVQAMMDSSDSALLCNAPMQRVQSHRG